MKMFKIFAILFVIFGSPHYLGILALPKNGESDATYYWHTSTDYKGESNGEENVNISDDSKKVTHHHLYHTLKMVDHFDNFGHDDHDHPKKGDDHGDKEKEKNVDRPFSNRKKMLGKKGKFDLKRYQDIDIMYNWLDTIATKHRDACQLLTIGRSVQNRTLKLLKIGLPSSNRGGGKRKPSIFVDAGIHAREWAAPTTALYMIYELLTKRTGMNRKILSNVDLYIIPMLNPDGYTISRNGRSRMWRKNGRKNPTTTAASSSAGGACNGVDLNRNFGYKFGGPGSDINPCSENYRGSKPFSEPETRAVRDFVKKNHKVNWKLYLSLHTYGQAILTPWGFTYDLPKDYKELKALGYKAAAAIKKVHGTSYRVGTSADLFGLAAGCSDDWAKGSGHFKYSYTMELRDMGKFGFMLPENQILPTAQETFEAFKVFAAAFFPSSTLVG